MLTKIIYKNFRSNLKNYILFFLSNIVAIMELFVFRGLKEIVLQIVKDTETAFLFRIDFTMAEYSCAMKSHFRKFGNQMSGSGNHLCKYMSLLA